MSSPQRRPRMRVLDGVADAFDGVLEPAEDARIVEFTLTELGRLLEELGGDGLAALVAYLKVLRKERTPDGRAVLVVERFSADWVREATGMGRTRALNAQRALVASGLLTPLVSAEGVGARGRQRGLLDSGLVYIPGGADGDISAKRAARRGPSPLLRATAKRENGTTAEGTVQVDAEVPETGSSATAPEVSVSRSSGIDDDGPFSRQSDNRQFGTAGAANAQVGPEVAETGRSGSRPTSTSGSGVISLLSGDPGPGLLEQVWLPLLESDPGFARSVVYPVFNVEAVAARSDALVGELGLDRTPTARAGVLTDLLADVMTGDRSARRVLAALKVAAHTDPLPAPLLAERVVVGIVAGLGMGKGISAWGGWLHTATAPHWSPRQNETLTAFTAALARAGLRPAAGASRPATPMALVSAPAAAAGAEPAADPDGGEDVGGLEVTDEDVAQHLPAALEMFPELAGRARRGGPMARAVVALYLGGGDPGQRTAAR